MALSEQDRTLMDQALRQGLSPEEQSRFDGRMRDPEFKAEYDIMKDLHAAARKRGREMLKEDLQQLERPLAVDKPKVSLLSPRVMWIAAAVVMLLALVVLFLISQKDRTEKLYAAHFSAPPNLVAPLQKGEESDPDSYRQAFRNYELGNYTEAEERFAQLDNSDPDVVFYRAITAMQLDRIDQAIFLLGSLVRGSDVAYRDHAQWYLALAYLANDDAESAFEMLKQITARSNHPYRTEAQALSEEF